MKTKELREIAKKNGYDYNLDEVSFTIVLERKGFLACHKITISGEIESCLWIKSSGCTSDMDLNMMEAAIAYAKTSLGDREEPKRYIIPLPGLMTTDGEQQFLTHKGRFFACRRNKSLRQTWKEKHLCYVPEQYRGYAVEVEE